MPPHYELLTFGPAVAAAAATRTRPCSDITETIASDVVERAVTVSANRLANRFVEARVNARTPASDIMSAAEAPVSQYVARGACWRNEGPEEAAAQSSLVGDIRGTV